MFSECLELDVLIKAPHDHTTDDTTDAKHLNVEILPTCYGYKKGKMILFDTHAYFNSETVVIYQVKYCRSLKFKMLFGRAFCELYFCASVIINLKASEIQSNYIIHVYSI